MPEKKFQNWRKMGLIIEPNKQLSWAQTHCMIPTPKVLGDGLVQIFFSGRDNQNRSHIGSATVDLKRYGRVIHYSSESVLSPGALGCFDDNGVTPSCVIDLQNGELAMYYIGWNPGSTVRMHIFGGLAISSDGGKSFTRWSRAPILERTITDPYLNTAPWVVKDGDGYRIFYVSGVSWIHKDLPRYNIKTGFSKDGKTWIREGQVCIDFCNETENALARPFVIKEHGLWRMWFSYKGSHYRIGYAESHDGINWERLDHLVQMECSDHGFDSEMIEYAAIVPHESSYYMFYNGNNYGYDGIGLAVLE